jgi:hypothetical protein
MNIIRVTKLAFCLLFLPVFAHARLMDKTQKPDSAYSIGMEVMLSRTVNFSLPMSLSENQYSPAFRILWKPEHYLVIGLQIAYLKLKETSQPNVSTPFGTTNFSGRLEAFPVNLVYSMQFLHFELSAGGGIAKINSQVSAYDETVKTSVYHNCFNLSVAYRFSLSKNIALSAFAEAQFFPKTEQSKIGIGIKMSYDFWY